MTTGLIVPIPSLLREIAVGKQFHKPYERGLLKVKFHNNKETITNITDSNFF